MISPMDPYTQSRLTKAAKAVIALANQGAHPTEALVKAATDHNLEPQQVRRVAEAFNVSRSLANQHQKQGSDRLNPFDLADADAALKKMFPGQYKTAGQERAAELAKTASASVPNFNELIARREKSAALQVAAPEKPQPAFPRRAFEKSAAEHARQERLADSALAQSQMRFTESLNKAASAVISNLHKVPFDRIEHAIVAKYGEGGTKLASLLWGVTNADKRHQKRASSFGTILQDYALSPFSEIDNFVKAALEVQLNAKEAARVRGSRPQDPFVKAAANQDSPGRPNEFAKYAFLDTTKSVLNNSFKGLTQVQDNPRYRQELADALNQIEDPDARDQMNAVKVKAMMHDLMTNDEVIRGYDKEEVLDRFNELAQLAPDVATQPMMVRSILRRALAQGQLDPFEASQFASVNRTLADNSAVDRSKLEALATDAQSLRPDLVQESGRSLGSQLASTLTGSFGARYADPKLKLQAAELDMRKKEMANRQVADKERAKFDKSKFDYQKENDEAQREAATAQQQSLFGHQRGMAMDERANKALQATGDRAFKALQATEDRAHTDTLAENKELFDSDQNRLNRRQALSIAKAQAMNRSDMGDPDAVFVPAGTSGKAVLRSQLGVQMRGSI